MKSKTLLYWASLLVVALPGFCAPASSVQFRLLAWTVSDLNLQFQSGKSPTEVSAMPTSFSPVYEYKNEGPITLFKMVEQDGKPLRQTACTITFPENIKHGLVILVPGDDTKALVRKVLPNSQGLVSNGAPLIYDYIVIDDSADAHPSGTIVFRNFSKLPVALSIGQRQLTLAPHDLVQIPLTPGAKRMPFRAAAQLGDGRWRLLASNPLPVSGANRLLVILRDGPEGAAKRPDEPNVTILPLFDWNPPAKPAEETTTPPVALLR